MLERETLTDMDEARRQRLADAADAVLNGPDRLKAEILDAGRAGEKPATIHRVIYPAYTYDYVARLVREDREANPGEYKTASPVTEGS
jgi:hypothetical protein